MRKETNDVAVSALGVLLGRLDKETEVSVDVRLVAVVVGDVRARNRRGAVALRGHCVLVGHVLRPVVRFSAFWVRKKTGMKRLQAECDWVCDEYKRKDLVKDLLLDCGEHLGVRLVDDNVHGLPVLTRGCDCLQSCVLTSGSLLLEEVCV